MCLNEVKLRLAWLLTSTYQEKSITSGKHQWIVVHASSRWWPQFEGQPRSPVNSFVMALFCRRAEQMSSSQEGRNSWWQARSSAMVLGDPGAERCSPSFSWRPSSTESTSRKRDCWGGLTLSRGRRMHLSRESNERVIFYFAIYLPPVWRPQAGYF